MARDWEKQHALLHRHSNIKFIKPTPRGRSMPVIERGEINFDKIGDRTLVIMAPIAAIAIMAILYVKGML